MEIGSTLEGIQSNQAQFNQASSSILEKLQSPEDDITKEILDQKVAQHGFSMNVRMAKVQDTMIGTLLDIVG